MCENRSLMKFSAGFLNNLDDLEGGVILLINWEMRQKSQDESACLLHKKEGNI